MGSAPAPQESWLPNAIIVGGFESNTLGEKIREEITKFAQNMPLEHRQHFRYAYTYGVMDSKGYLRVSDNLPSETIWSIVASLKSNNSEFGEGRTRWASRAKIGQALAKTAKVRDVIATTQSLRAPAQGQSYLVDAKKLKVLLSPSGETIAKIPYECAEPSINTALLRTRGNDSATWDRAYKETIEKRRFL